MLNKIVFEEEKMRQMAAKAREERAGIKRQTKADEAGEAKERDALR